MIQKYSATETEATPAVAGTSKPTTRTLKIFKVLVLLTLSELLNLRVFKIAAQTKKEAKKLASEMIRRLDSDQIEAISANALEVEEGTNAIELIDVYEMLYDIPGPGWTRAEIESDDLAKLVEQAAAQLKHSSEQAEPAKANNITSIRRRFDAMTPDQHARMKRNLLRLAKSGAPRPEANSLEGYAFARYTTATPGRCSFEKGVELN